ncbi:MAG: hypothetical protein IKW52_06260 [Alistipes sp.]|nr:hypothetical protein [Alistipes sp.]
MKRKIVSLLFAFVALVVAGSVTAQTLNSSYFMEGSYFRTDMNPALTPTRGYVAIPILSGVGAEVNTNFMSVDKFFFKKDGQVVTGLNSLVSADEFLGRLPKTEKMSANVSFNFISAGFYRGKMYWNFGVNIREQADMALSKDVFTVLKTFGNGTYDLNRTALNANVYGETYVGATYPVLEWLTVGARLKFLTGIVNIAANFDQMSASVTPENIKGDLSGTININAPVVALTNMRPGDTFNFDIFNLANGVKLGSFGAAIDLGAEAEFLDKSLRVSAAVTDLGFIKWSRKTTAVADIDGAFYFNGVDFATAEPDYGFDASMTMSEASNSGYTKMINCSLNVGAEYNILNNRIGFGLLSHTEFYNSMAYSELTVSANFRPLNWLSATLSHTLLSGNKAGVFGFAFNIHCPGLNLFLGMDYIDTRYVKYENMSVPRMASSVNAYFGLGFNIGKYVAK